MASTALVVNCGSAGGEVTTTDAGLAAACASVEQANADRDALNAAQDERDRLQREAEAAQAAQAAADQQRAFLALRAEVQGYVDAGVVHPAITAMAKMIGAV